MAKANDAETTKGTSNWEWPYSTWGVIAAVYWSIRSAASLYNGINSRHGIASLIFWAVMVFSAPNVLWQRRRLRLRREQGIPDPALEGKYVPSLFWPVLLLLMGAGFMAQNTGSVVAWDVVGLLAFGFVHLNGISAVVDDQSVTVRNGQFRRRRTVRYSEIASLRMVRPAYPFTRSRLLEIGLNGGETLRVLAISDDRVARPDEWSESFTGSSHRLIPPAPMLGKIREHTGLPIQIGVGP